MEFSKKTADCSQRRHESNSKEWLILPPPPTTHPNATYFCLYFVCKKELKIFLQY